MVNSDWNIVFKLKDFIDYLTNNDSIQLSMSSKKLRKPLIKDSFKTFNFSSFTSTKDYSSLFIKRETNKYGYQFDTYINPFKPLTRELIEFRKEFCNDLKLLNRSPKNLLVNDYGMYHYLLNEIPSIFPNITTLVLDGSVFTVDTFQYLLDNFKSLENLEITHSSIFLYLESSNDYTFNYLTNYHVNYPISLRNFKTIEFMVIMVKDNVSPFSKNHFCGNNVFEYDLIHQHLPNLVSFDYGMENDWPDESEDLINFIKLNSQLNSLKLCGSNFKFELFDIIKDFENLTHLEFKCFNFWEDLMDYEMPVLYNIKNLHIEIFQENIDAMVIDKFPNLTELVIEFDRNISNESNRLIESFSNLNSLKFISTCFIEIEENLTFNKLKCLEKIEFNLNYEEGNFEDVQWDVSACDKLKLITYTKNEIYSPFEMPKLTEELAKHWDFYYFPHKLTFIKNN